MVKLINKHIMKIMLDNIEMGKLFHKNNKHIKIIMELIELHKKECLMIEVIKLLNKKKEMIFNKLIITLIWIKNKFKISIPHGEIPINK